MIDYLTPAKAFLARLEAFGYSEIHSVEVHLSLDGTVTFHCLLVDDFQKDAAWDQQVQNGFRRFNFEDGAFILPDDFKTREQRELHFMAKRFGNSKELAAQMVSAAGRAFAERMEAELANLRTMLEAPK